MRQQTGQSRRMMMGMLMLVAVLSGSGMSGSRDALAHDSVNIAAALSTSSDLSGGLDPTFGTAGVVTTDSLGRPDDYLSSNELWASLGRRGGLGPPDESVNDATLQADGKILVVSSAVVRSTQGRVETDFAVTRFTPDGALDTTFGNGGRVTTDISAAYEDLLDAPQNDRPNAVMVQPV